MATRKTSRTTDKPREILMPMDGSEEEAVGSEDHNPRTNSAMRDGNGSRGIPAKRRRTNRPRTTMSAMPRPLKFPKAAAEVEQAAERRRESGR